MQKYWPRFLNPFHQIKKIDAFKLKHNKIQPDESNCGFVFSNICLYNVPDSTKWVLYKG